MMEFESVRDILEGIADEQQTAGRNPYIAPIGGSMVEASMKAPLGAFGYVQAVIELREQADAAGLHMDFIVVPTGSAGTHAGLLAGAAVVCPDTKVIGISVGDDRAIMSQWAKQIANQALEALGQLTSIRDDAVIVRDEYYGEGYGLLTPQTVAAIRRTAAAEGLLLDPVYTGKAMAGLLDLVQTGEIAQGSNVVFMHTGGTPALFPYRDLLR